MNMKTPVPWDVSPSILVDRYQSSEATLSPSAAPKAGLALSTLNIGLFYSTRCNASSTH